MSENVANDSVAERLDRIERQLARLTGALDPLGPTLAMAVDAADEVTAGLQRRGVDMDGRVRDGLALVERLTEPATMSALSQVVDALPRLLPLIELATTFEDTTGMVFDMADAQVARLQARGIDVESRLQQVGALLTRLTDPEMTAHLEQLADAAPGLLAATRTGELFGRAVDEAGQKTSPSLGLWGLMGALREPEVQRAAGFAVDVARRVGRRLPEHVATSRPVLTTAAVPSAK